MLACRGFELLNPVTGTLESATAADHRSRPAYSRYDAARDAGPTCWSPPPGTKLSARMCLLRRAPAPPPRRPGQHLHATEAVPLIGKFLGKPASLPRLNEVGSPDRRQPPQEGVDPR